MDSKPMILSIEKLKASYNGNSVLENLDLKIKENEIVAIVGKSGCGKTTLLNAVAGFIKFKGRIKKPDTLGVVFQNHAVFPWMKVKENISFGLKVSKKSDYYIKMAGLEGKKDSFPFQLSGGEVQRVALARTLAQNPKLILMDEPYGALDAYTRGKMQEWLLKIRKKEQKTILIVTHSIEEAIYLADRVLLLKDKKIIKEFNINFSMPRTPKIKFSRKFAALSKKITESIDDSANSF